MKVVAVGHSLLGQLYPTGLTQPKKVLNVNCDNILLLLQPLRWHCAGMRGSPRTECARRKALYMRGANKQ